MGSRQARSFRPTLDGLESKVVLSVAGVAPVASVAPASPAPIALMKSTYDQVLSKVDQAFVSYEGPLDDALNALGQFASDLASAALSPNSPTDPNADSNNGDSFVSGGKGDAAALQNRLQAALKKLPGGLIQTGSLIDRTFAQGGLTPSDAGYFRAQLRSMIEHYISRGIKSGEFVMVQHAAHHPAVRTP